MDSLTHIKALRCQYVKVYILVKITFPTDERKREKTMRRDASIVGVSLLGCVAVACSFFGDDDDERGPPAELVVSAVRDLGTIETNSAITMRDGGYSAQFQGASVWLYGDSFLAFDNADSLRLLSNTWSSTQDPDASDGIGAFSEPLDQMGAPKSFFPLTNEEKTFIDLHKGDNCMETPCNARWALWPGAIVTDDNKGWAYVFYEKIYAEPGDFNFHGVGLSIAVWKVLSDPPERPVFNHVENFPTLFFSSDEPGFGSAALRVGTQVYVYGCDLKDLVKPCRLGRVAIADVLEKRAWEYYSGNGKWSSNLHDATPVFNGNDIMSVFYNDYIERYVAVYSEPLDTNTLLRTAPEPQGPWSKPVKAFSAQAPNNSIGWVYDALAHPEFSRENGRFIYISYSREIAPFTGEVRLVEVQLEKALAK